MRADLVLIGNDVHLPLQEMAAHLTANCRAAAELPANRVVSIQSRKGPAVAGETVISRRFSRAAQLASLLRTLGSFPRAAKLVYIGNGNQTLLTALTLFARLRRQRFVFYPLGAVTLPRAIRPDWIWVPHGRLIEHYQREGQSAARIAIVPPFPGSIAVASKPRQWQEGRALFASVPPHPSEFAARGLPLLFEGIRRANELGISIRLTVLNRYTYLDVPLAALIEVHRCAEFVALHTALVDDMPSFLDRFDLAVAPAGGGPLPQTPLTAIESLTLGIPVLAASSLALAEDLHRYQAGALFDSSSSFVEAVRSVRDSFPSFSQGALRLASERYSMAQGQSAFFESCARLSEH